MEGREREGGGERMEGRERRGGGERMKGRERRGGGVKEREGSIPQPLAMSLFVVLISTLSFFDA